MEKNTNPVLILVFNLCVIFLGTFELRLKFIDKFEVPTKIYFLLTFYG